MSLKDRIKSVAGDINLSDFADRIGVHVTAISKWDDKRWPSGRILKKIKEEFGVNIDWLLTGRGAPYINKVSGVPGTVSSLRDGNGLYGRTRRHDLPDGDLDVTLFEPEEGDDEADSFARAVGGLREIYDSKDPIIVPALHANIRAFRLAVHRERQIHEQSLRIKALEDECDVLKDRLENLEKKFEEKLDRGGGKAVGGSL